MYLCAHCDTMLGQCILQCWILGWEHQCGVWMYWHPRGPGQATEVVPRGNLGLYWLEVMLEGELSVKLYTDTIMHVLMMKSIQKQSKVKNDAIYRHLIHVLCIPLFLFQIMFFCYFCQCFYRDWKFDGFKNVANSLLSLWTSKPSKRKVKMSFSCEKEIQCFHP